MEHHGDPQPQPQFQHDEGGFEDKLRNPESFRWLVCQFALMKVKEVISTHVEEVSKKQHEVMVAQLGNDAKPCSNNPPNCKSCPVCDRWIVEIKKLKQKFVNLRNGRSDKWATSHWEISKVFMGPGQDKSKDVKSCDIAGILRLMINCKSFSYTSAECAKIKKVVDIRNNLMHNPTHKIEQSETLTDSINSCIAVVNMTLSKGYNDQFIKEAVEELERVKVLTYEDVLEAENASAHGSEVTKVMDLLRCFFNQHENINRCLRKDITEDQAIIEQNQEIARKIRQLEQQSHDLQTALSQPIAGCTVEEIALLKENWDDVFNLIHKPDAIIAYLYNEDPTFYSAINDKIRGEKTLVRKCQILKEAFDPDIENDSERLMTAIKEMNKSVYKLLLMKRRPYSDNAETLSGTLEKEHLRTYEGDILEKEFETTEIENTDKIIRYLHLEDAIGGIEYKELTTCTDQRHAKLIHHIRSGTYGLLIKFQDGLKKYDRPRNCITDIILKNTGKFTSSSKELKEALASLKKNIPRAKSTFSNIVDLQLEDVQEGSIKLITKAESWEHVQRLQRDIFSQAIYGKVSKWLKTFHEPRTGFLVSLELVADTNNKGRLEEEVRFAHCDKKGAWYWTCDNEHWQHTSRTKWEFDDKCKDCLPQSADMNILQMLMLRHYQKETSCSCIVCTTKEVYGVSYVKDETHGLTKIALVIDFYDREGTDGETEGTENESDSLSEDESVATSSNSSKHTNGNERQKRRKGEPMKHLKPTDGASESTEKNEVLKDENSEDMEGGITLSCDHVIQQFQEQTLEADPNNMNFGDETLQHTEEELSDSGSDFQQPKQVETTERKAKTERDYEQKDDQERLKVSRDGNLEDIEKDNIVANDEDDGISQSRELTLRTVSSNTNLDTTFDIHHTPQSRPDMTDQKAASSALNTAGENLSGLLKVDVPESYHTEEQEMKRQGDPQPFTSSSEAKADKSEFEKQNDRSGQLATLYRKYLESRKQENIPATVVGTQLNRIRNIIYLYVLKGSKEQGRAYIDRNKHLKHIQNIDVIEIEDPRPLSLKCNNCQKENCGSLQGILDKKKTPWVGPGSPILCVDKEVYERFIKDHIFPQQESYLDTLEKIQGYLFSLFRLSNISDQNSQFWFGGKFFSVGFPYNYNDSRSIVTCYHPIQENQDNGSAVILLSEIVQNGKSRVILLCSNYVAKDVSNAKGVYNLHRLHDILCFEVDKDIITGDLLKTKVKNFCENMDGETDVNFRFIGMPDPGALVVKRGARSGVTYGKVIGICDYVGGNQAFFVGSTTSDTGEEALFSQEGDSGSVVFQPINEAIARNHGNTLNAYGLIYGIQQTMNNETGNQVNATMCFSLSANLEALSLP